MDHPPPQSRTAGSGPDAAGRVGLRISPLRTLTFAVLYGVVAYLGRQTAAADVHVALVYPAVGIAVVWLYAPRHRRVQAVDVALLTAITYVVTAATDGWTVIAAGLTVAHVVQAVSFAAIMRRLRTPGPGALTSARDVPPLLAATLGSTALALLAVVAVWGATGALDASTVLMWFSRNAASVLVVASVGLRLDPIVVHHLQRRTPTRTVARPRVGRRTELVVAVTSSLLAYVLVFARVDLPVAFVLLLFSMWVAVRFDTTVAAVHSLLVGSVAVALTVIGHGPFAVIPDARVAALVVQAFVGVVTLVTLTLSLGRDERDALVRRLQHAAASDSLTGLANRRHWDTAIEAEISRASATGAPLALALVDLDHFKRFNDQHGHLAGDELLREFAVAATGCLRAEDTLARWGGEEFVLALPGCDVEAATVVAERVRSSVPRGQTCTIGVAAWRPGLTARAVVDLADAALYEGKASGRDVVVVHRGASVMSSIASVAPSAASA